MIKIVVLAENETAAKKLEEIVSAESHLKILEKSLQATPTRTHVSASTHLGIQLVPLQDIYYFQAEHKYVMVYHAHGELLIDDSLNSLENEFSKLFVRTHRKTLVAINQISDLSKDDAGKYFVKIRGLSQQLSVSRRQLPQVRQALLCI